MAKNVLVTAGPIVAKIDSVKILTNKFKGGLAIKTANYLAEQGHNVTVLTSKHSGIKIDNLKHIQIDDVYDYFDYIKNSNGFDSFILAAAVANLSPVNPYEGKFPSHKYKVGEKFNIEFEIAPRIIDEIKKIFPRSDLIGYKLYDGSEQDLIQAGKKTLFDSLANIVFANNPNTAKDKKIVLTQDGACFNANFDEHLKLINKLLNSKFYKTNIIEANYQLNDDDLYIINNYPTYQADGRNYGTFAIRKNNGFITTTRGKKNGNKEVSFVSHVNNLSNEIFSDKKATLNAPLLNEFFVKNKNINFIYHGHDIIGDIVWPEYEFAGSDKELVFASKEMKPNQEICLPFHGFIIGFETIDEFKNYLNKKHYESK